MYVCIIFEYVDLLSFLLLFRPLLSNRNPNLPVTSSPEDS